MIWTNAINLFPVNISVINDLEYLSLAGIFSLSDVCGLPELITFQLLPSWIGYWHWPKILEETVNARQGQTL
jgi:hypothetical protein